MTHISLGEADSLGVSRVCIYYSDGDVQAYTGGESVSQGPRHLDVQYNMFR